MSIIEKAGLGLIPSKVRGNAALFENVSLWNGDLVVVVDDGNPAVQRLRAVRNGVLVTGFGHLADSGSHYRKVVLQFEELQTVH